MLARTWMAKMGMAHRAALRDAAADLNTFEAGLILCCILFLTCGASAYQQCDGVQGSDGDRSSVSTWQQKAVTFLLIASFTLSMLYMMYMLGRQTVGAVRQNRGRRQRASVPRGPRSATATRTRR